MNLTEYFYSLVSQIPKGRVSTYGALARALGDIRAARAVGQMLNANPYAPIVPCHRVVMSDGGLGGFGTGIEKKIELLQNEGVHVSKGHIIDFKRILFTDFRSDHPLEKFRQEQLDMRDKIDIDDDFQELKVIAGVDVAYRGNRGYGGYVAFDHETKTVVERKAAEWIVDMPYIPTYLAYRESPVLEFLLGKVENRPQMLLVDGNGILHPYKAGIASHVGVKLNIPTIGVAKSQLCGESKGIIKKKGDFSEIVHEGEMLGYALKSSSRSKKYIYVSPGHRVSFKTALEITKSYCKYKIPDPIRQAHKLASEKRDAGKLD